MCSAPPLPGWELPSRRQRPSRRRRSVDEVDVAKDASDRFERMALEQQLATMPKGEAAEECVECGEPIPEARRNAVPGCIRCISCQTAVERKRGGPWVHQVCFFVRMSTRDGDDD